MRRGGTTFTKPGFNFSASFVVIRGRIFSFCISMHPGRYGVAAPPAIGFLQPVVALLEPVFFHDPLMTVLKQKRHSLK